jgi:DNA-binding beta-propeller fold protein YncE
MKIALALCFLGCTALAAQRVPAPTELPGDPFFIKKTWQVGGGGDSLSYMVLDPVRLQLFLAYRHSVVVEDVKSGTAAGRISESSGAFGIALDDTGEFGYFSDGRFNNLNVFDRRTLKVVGIIPTAPNPATVLFEPASNLVFVICKAPLSGQSGAQELAEQPWLRTDVADLRPPIRPGQPQPAARRVQARPATKEKGENEEIKSIVTVIDANSWKALADIQLPGKVAFAQAAGDGQVYFGIPGQKEIARMDAEVLGEKLRREAPIPAGSTPKQEQLQAGHPLYPGPQWQQWRRDAVPALDWSGSHNLVENGASQIIFFPLNQECSEPRTLAVDKRHLRLFVACENMKMAVLNADTGQWVASLTTGPNTDALAYDFDRGLIYAANSGGDGSLTIIRQSVTDSYAVIQNLPTPHWARTLAFDPVTGLVYLAADYSDLEGSKRPRDPAGRGFQLLVVGH